MLWLLIVILLLILWAISTVDIIGDWVELSTGKLYKITNISGTQYAVVCQLDGCNYSIDYNPVFGTIKSATKKASHNRTGRRVFWPKKRWWKLHTPGEDYNLRTQIKEIYTKPTLFGTWYNPDLPCVVVIKDLHSAEIWHYRDNRLIKKEKNLQLKITQRKLEITSSAGTHIGWWNPHASIINCTLYNQVYTFHKLL